MLGKVFSGAPVTTRPNGSLRIIQGLKVKLSDVRKKKHILILDVNEHAYLI